MKSGRHIYRRLRRFDDPMEAIRGLGNGSLRSLIRHLARKGELATHADGMIYGMAHVAATERFMARGKGKWL